MNKVKIMKELCAVRDSGLTNMFDTNAVMEIAYVCGFQELASFVVGNSSEYVGIILKGKFADGSSAHDYESDYSKEFEKVGHVHASPAFVFD